MSSNRKDARLGIVLHLVEDEDHCDNCKKSVAHAELNRVFDVNEFHDLVCDDCQDLLTSIDKVLLRLPESVHARIKADYYDKES